MSISENLIAPLGHLGLLAVEGQNAEKFLQGQLSCDIREINAQQSRFTAYCNHKGRIIATLRVFKWADQYYLLLPKSLLQTTREQLHKYAVFSKVLVKDISEQFSMTGYCDANEPSNSLNMPEKVDQVTIKNEMLFCKLHSPFPRYLILELKTKQSTWEKLAPTAKIIDENAWRLLDIQAGISHIYPQTTSLFTPHMIQLPALGGVSFNKGCYVGQEIISRTQYLGKNKRQLHLFALHSEHQHPQPGDSLYNAENQPVGTLIDAGTQSQKSYELLAVIQGNLKENEAVFWNNLKLEPLELVFS